MAYDVNCSRADHTRLFLDLNVNVGLQLNVIVRNGSFSPG